MSTGGGYRPPPDNSLQVQREQNEYNDRIRAEEAARAARERQEARNAFNESRAAAQNQARQQWGGRLSTLGLDPNEYNWVIERAISRGDAAMPDLNNNPSAFYNDDVLDTVINTAQADRRTNYQRQLDGLFGSRNAATSIFGDDSDDSFIDAVLGRQRENAMRQITAARDRGNLNETGFNNALSNIDRMATAGRSRANTLGNSVLTNYRNQINSIVNNAYDAANTYRLGSRFDPSSFKSEYDSRVNTLRGKLGGDIEDLIGNENFFDIGNILTRAGTTQGAVNPSMNLDAIAQRDRIRNTERGLGGGGGTF